MTLIRRQLGSPAMIVACVALVVALGGVSYAAAVLPKNSVGTAQLKKRAVTGAKLRKNAVTGAKVKNGSLMAADFKAAQLPAGPQGAKGDPGPQGAKGEKGDKGDPGSAGVAGVVNRATAWTTVPGNSVGQAEAKCHPGELAIGGGFVVGASGLVVESSNSGNVSSPTSWIVHVKNTTGTAQDFVATVMCAGA